MFPLNVAVRPSFTLVGPVGVLTIAFTLNDTGAHDVVSYVAEGETRGKFLHRGPSGETQLIEKPNEYEGLSLDDARGRMPMTGLLRCRLEGIRILEATTLLEIRDIGDEERAERGLHKMALKYPEFIDVFHHLGLIYEATGRAYAASAAWKYAATIGIVAIPDTFKHEKHRLPWSIFENRPFFRACHAWGLDLLERGEVGLALGLFRNMLLWNPNDNQGVRDLVVNCAFRLNRPDAVVNLRDRYGSEWELEGLVFGLPLALYMLGERKRARDEFNAAAQVYPLIAREIVGKQHHPPRPLNPPRVVVGSEQQARLYWHDSGRFWKGTPGALEFFRKRFKA